MWYLLPIFLLGFLTPIQTAANSRLRQSVASPLIASLVSFSVGTVFLIIVTLIQKGTLFFGNNLFSELPWWAWLGGVCGLYGLTVNIIIFPKIGAVQTALMPMLGQICMGMVIDTLGLFHAQVFALSLLRFLSLILILLGVCMVVIKKNSCAQNSKSFIWQIIGISGGAIFAMQPQMNSLLSIGLYSSVHAAFVSFLSATVILFIIVLISSDRKKFPKIFSFNRPWWSWLGGMIGGTFVTGFAFFADKTGIGILLITSICGLLTCSLMIDKYGLFGTERKRIRSVQYFGLICVIAGIIILRLG